MAGGKYSKSMCIAWWYMAPINIPSNSCTIYHLSSDQNPKVNTVSPPTVCFTSIQFLPSVKIWLKQNYVSQLLCSYLEPGYLHPVSQFVYRSTFSGISHSLFCSGRAFTEEKRLFTEPSVAAVSYCTWNQGSCIGFSRTLSHLVISHCSGESHPPALPTGGKAYLGGQAIVVYLERDAAKVRKYVLLKWALFYSNGHWIIAAVGRRWIEVAGQTQILDLFLPDNSELV